MIFPDAPHVSLNHARIDRTVTGLLYVEIGIANSTDDGRPTHYILSVAVADNEEPVFTKRIDVISVASFLFAVNSHLLPNGVSQLTFSLLNEAGTVVWTHSLELTVSNLGALADSVRESLRRFNSPTVIDGLCDSTHFDYRDEQLKPWFDRDDADLHIYARRAEGKMSDAEAELLKSFCLDGYLVLADLLDEDLLRQINAELDEAVTKKLEGYEFGSSQRIHQLHEHYPGVRKLWGHPRILRILSLIFEQPARPCQSLTYIFGSQQSAHQDTIHLTPFPAGYMCGVWTALQDVEPDSGELEVYKGSHRLPRVYMNDAGCHKIINGDLSEYNSRVVPIWNNMLTNGKFERIVYRPKKGTVLIWHENLMHGGSVRIDKSLSRRSIVTHNFADGAIAYYDSSGHVAYMEPLENLPS